MYQAEAFSENCNRQRAPIAYALEHYVPLIRWNRSGANVVDVGCGPGDVTIEMLLPLLPANFKSLIGFDQSAEMVQFAEKKFGRERVDFVVGDLEGSEISANLEAKFDHVFSFFCLHWVNNQKQGFANLNYILKTGGNMLLTFLADAPHFHAYESMYNTEKWRKHIVGYDKHLCPFLHVAEPEQMMRETLEWAEFDIKVCKVLDWNFYFKDRTDLKDALIPVNPFVGHMSEKLQCDYMDDLAETILKDLNHKEDSEEIILPHKVFVVVATKRNNLR